MHRKIILSSLGALIGTTLIIYFFFPGFILQTLVRYERGNANLVLKKLQVRDHSIAYLTNDPDGMYSQRPTIVFIHGFAADKDNWTRMAKYFKDEYRIIALDQPGFGESSRIPSHIYSLPNQVAYIHSALINLNIATPGKRYHRF